MDHDSSTTLSNVTTGDDFSCATDDTSHTVHQDGDFVDYVQFKHGWISKVNHDEQTQLLLPQSERQENSPVETGDNDTAADPGLTLLPVPKQAHLRGLESLHRPTVRDAIDTMQQFWRVIEPNGIRDWNSLKWYFKPWVSSLIMLYMHSRMQNDYMMRK